MHHHETPLYSRPVYMDVVLQNVHFYWSYSRQAVETRTKAMNLPPGLDAVHVAQALGEGRGSQADVLVAMMETKGVGRIDLYEVGRIFLVAAAHHWGQPRYLAVYCVEATLLVRTYSCRRQVPGIKC